MVIVDNADDPRFLVEPPGEISQRQYHNAMRTGVEERCIDYFPVCEHGALLLTSRSFEAVRLVLRPDDVMNVPPMDAEHACALLRKRMGDAISCDIMDLHQLSKWLDYMPLALAQAASYIRQKAPRCSVRRYLEKLNAGDRSQLSLLSHDDGDPRRDREAENSILLTWEISFNQIQQDRPSAADLLSLMSFFDRHAIPEYLLRNRSLVTTESTALKSEDYKSHNEYDRFYLDGSSSDTESEIFDDDLQILRHYSLVTVTADPSMFEMHRLVQLATRRWLEFNERFERWAECFTRNLDDAFPIAVFWDAKISQTIREMLPHVDRARRLSKRGAPVLIGPEVSLLLKIACFAFRKEKSGLAEAYEEIALRLLKLKPRGRHEIALQTMRTLGSTHFLRSQFTLAESLFVKGVELASQFDKKLHVLFMCDLAETCVKVDRPEDAERLQLNCVEILGKLDSEDDSLPLELMGHIASVCQTLGKHEEAVRLLVERLELAKKADIAAREVMLETMGSLAMAYMNLGKYEEAESIQRQAVKKSMIEFGGEHRITCTGILNQAVICFARDQPTAAASLLNEGLGKIERGPRSQHTAILSCMEDIREIVVGIFQDEVEDAERNLSTAYLQLSRLKQTELEDTLKDLSENGENSRVTELLRLSRLLQMEVDGLLEDGKTSKSTDFYRLSMLIQMETEGLLKDETGSTLIRTEKRKR